MQCEWLSCFMTQRKCHTLKQQNTYYNIFKDQLKREYYSRKKDKLKLHATLMLTQLGI